MSFDIAVIAFLAIVGVITIIACTIQGLYQQRLKANSLGDKDRARLDGLSARIEQLEKRMANLETIVIESEKQKDFDQLVK